MTILGSVLKPFFDVQPRHLPRLTTADNATAVRLRQVVYTVTEGCELTLRTAKRDALIQALDRYPPELRGFAYEGAGVALGALDYVSPWKRRTSRFVDGPASAYRYAVYLGAGMGLARFCRNPERFRLALGDDVFSWIVLDGYGFHEGFFRHRRHVQEQALPAWLSGYGVTAFDQGLGRSIWFVTGADPDRITRTIDAFPPQRRGDLWAGIGLACGYTGGVEEASVRAIDERAGELAARLREGVLVAAMNRHGAGNPAEHNEIATWVLCGQHSADAARSALDALVDLPHDDVVPAYAVWRNRLRTVDRATPDRRPINGSALKAGAR